MTVPYIMGRDSITVMHDGNTHTVMSDHVNYEPLRAAIRDQQWHLVPDLVSPLQAVESFVNKSSDQITIQDGQVYYQGTVVHNSVSVRILDMIRDGFDAQPLMRFLGKLMSNPSRTAVTELYDWLAGTKLPITEEGDFIAYKKVRSDYRDFYTGKVLNKPAHMMTDAELAQMPVTVNGVTTSVENGLTVLSMPRNQVDDNRDRTCSQGLHFCSLSYLPSYHGGEGRVLLVRINPADVVSIPSDYDFAKGRAWRYAVIGEHTAGERTEAFTTSVVDQQGTQTNTTATTTPNTHAMGVDFGSEARAAQVAQLVEQVSARVPGLAGDGPDQGRVDGFDDAWDDLQPNIMRFGGSNIRDAVEYARAYYEGYDRCRGKTSATQAPMPATSTTVTTRKRNPALVGYNQGRKHGAALVRFDNSTQEFTGSDLLMYESAYIKGYNSVK
jgi:hypothetical protein